MRSRPTRIGEGGVLRYYSFRSIFEELQSAASTFLSVKHPRLREALDFVEFKSFVPLQRLILPLITIPRGQGMRVAVIDIGKPGRNLGWAIDDPKRNGTDLDGCIEELVAALDEDALALGFEAPQFVPVRHDQNRLLEARQGETGSRLAPRPFSAAPGATVLVSSLVIVPYVLQRLRERVPRATATLDWRRPMTEPRQLLLWEAFVTDQRRDTETRHVEDACLAIADFRRGIADPNSFQSSVTASECLSLLGAALLRTGWSTDVALLSMPCLVVRSASAAAHA